MERKGGNEGGRKGKGGKGDEREAKREYGKRKSFS